MSLLFFQPALGVFIFNKMTYKKQLKHPKWQKRRLEILQRDKWTCKLCSDQERTLHVHHKKYEKGKLAWEYPASNFVTLCERCHEIVTHDSEQYDNYDFDNVEYYISEGWTSGSIIIFLKINDTLGMQILDQNRNHIVGFNLDSQDLIPIQKLITKAIKSWRTN